MTTIVIIINPNVALSDAEFILFNFLLISGAEKRAERTKRPPPKRHADEDRHPIAQQIPKQVRDDIKKGPDYSEPLLLAYFRRFGGEFVDSTVSLCSFFGSTSSPTASPPE